MKAIRICTTLLALGLAASALTACSDPAASKPKAEVSEPKPVASPDSAGSAAPSASAEAKPAADEDLAMAMPAGAIALSPGDSTIAFTGSKVTGKHDGDFKAWKGWVALKDGAITGAQVHVTIDLGSVKTDSEKLDGHLKAPDFFNVASFPKATFTTTSITEGGDGDATHTIEGNLKMVGVEKSVKFPAKITEDGGVLKAEAEFSINRKDWKIMYDGKKDDLIRDDVIIKLSLSAKKS